MIKTLHLRDFRRYILLMSVLILVIPCVSHAQDQKAELQGYYSNKLKNRTNFTNSRIVKNLKNYKRNKSIALLDESYNMIMQLRYEIDYYLNASIQKLLEAPENAEMRKLNAQIDKLEIITIRDAEMPYLCDRLYELGQLYIKVDKEKAKRCFRDIDEKFASCVSGNCVNNAKSVLERLK